MQRFVDLVIFACIGTGAYYGSQELLQYATSTQLIYKLETLPPFKPPTIYNQRGASSMVRLESKDHAKSQGDFFCSGTVISDDYVLTAAHCLTQRSILGVVGLHEGEITIVSVKDPKTGTVTTATGVAAAVNTRADYGLIKGDFKKFNVSYINTSPAMTEQLVGPVATCGFPWGAEPTCYAVTSNLQLSFEQFAARGLMYPGMSGGPVVDMGGSQVIAVNTAVGDGFIVVSPLVGLFETLGVEVVVQ